MIHVNRGVEYHVQVEPYFTNYISIASEYFFKFKSFLSWSKGLIIVASIKATDERLLDSKYFNERKEDWFKDIHHYKKTKIDDVDISLNDKEKKC